MDCQICAGGSAGPGGTDEFKRARFAPLGSNPSRNQNGEAASIVA
jgi:hypothetical protein